MKVKCCPICQSTKLKFFSDEECDNHLFFVEESDNDPVTLPKIKE